MKKKILHIMIVALTVMAYACSNESEMHQVVKPEMKNTYPLQLNVDISCFDNGITRSEYRWPDNTQLVLQFYAGTERISGLATYNQKTDQWTVTTNQQLTADSDGDCNAYYFVNASGTSVQNVTLNPHSVIYQDTEGSFTLTEDHVMIVKLQLTPRSGRVRFKGTASAKFGVTGLSYHTSYSIIENKFTMNANKLTGSFDKDGDTDYYYVTFADDEKRQLTVDGTGKGAFIRCFGSEVLAQGQSGYFTLPSADNLPKGWTLINTDNQQEISLPTVSVTNVSKLRSHFATATASVISLGNGTLSEVGFIYSTHSDPTTANGSKVDAGKSSAIEARLVSLMPKTTYYIKAYAVNERGTTYGSVSNFTTLSEEEDGTSFGLEDFGEDEDLNNSSSSNGIINKEGYGNDEDLNNSTSSNGTINKEGYGNDEDLNNSTSSNGTINKNEFGNDENWN